MLQLPLDFKNGLTIDALVDSTAYAKEMVKNEADRINQQAPGMNFKVNKPSYFSNTSRIWSVRETIGNTHT